MPILKEPRFITLSNGRLFPRTETDAGAIPRAADIAHWPDVAQKGDTVADIFPMLKAEIVYLYAALHRAHQQLADPIKINVRQWHRQEAGAAEAYNFRLAAREAEQLRNALDQAHRRLDQQAPEGRR